MADTQAFFPVQFARPKEEGDDNEFYEASIASNEEMLNQNFTIVDQRLVAALEKINELEAKINGN